MPFRYEAFNREGGRVRGTVEAESRGAAEQVLWDSGLTILDLRSARKPFLLHEQLPSLFGVRQDDVISFANLLAFLIEAGINIYAGLQIVRDQMPHPALRAILSQLTDDIASGVTLAEACQRHPTVFPTLFVRLVKVGEETGRLDAMLRKVATYMERRRAAMAKARSALAYPAFVSLTAGISMYIMLVVALPNLIGLFKEFGAELPLTTRIVIRVVGFAGAYGQSIALALLLGLLLVISYGRTRAGSRRIDYALLRVPLIGPLVAKINLARLADTMASLISAGIPMSEALDLLLETTQNAAVREPLQRVREDILSGSFLSEALGRNSIFPKMMVNLVRVGEEVGTLEKTFQLVGQWYNEEAERTMARLIGMMEPALTVFIGAAVGLIAVTIIGTIYSVLPQIH